MVEDSAASQLIREVRAFGLDAAREVARRFSQLAGQEGHDDGHPWLDPSWVIWEDLVRSVGRYPFSGVATRSQSDDRLVAPVTAPGRTTTTKLWLHNTADQPLSVDAVRVSALQSRAGHQLADCWHFDRSPPFAVPPGASMAITITVRIPPSTPQGRFQGLIFVAPNGIEPIRFIVAVESEPALRR